MKTKNNNSLLGVNVIKKLVKFVFDVISGTTKDNVGAYSAQTAFFVTISFIPFIMMLISIVKFLPITQEHLLSQIVAVFPAGAREFVASFVTETYEKSGAAVISITAVSTLWASSIGVFSLTRGLSRVYNSEELKNYFAVRFMSMIYTLFIMVMLLLCLGIFVFGNTITEGLLKIFPEAFGVALIVMSFRKIVGVAVLSVFFLLMYIFVPGRKLSPLAQIPGALLSGAGWIGFSYAFSYYYENLSDYSYLYGSLSVMVFFMLWLFFCIYILFIGAEVNKCIADRIERTFLMK